MARWKEVACPQLQRSHTSSSKFWKKNVMDVTKTTWQPQKHRQPKRAKVMQRQSIPLQKQLTNRLTFIAVQSQSHSLRLLKQRLVTHPTSQQRESTNTQEVSAPRYVRRWRRKSNTSQSHTARWPIRPGVIGHGTWRREHPQPDKHKNEHRLALRGMNETNPDSREWKKGKEAKKAKADGMFVVIQQNTRKLLLLAKQNKLLLKPLKAFPSGYEFARFC